jgi:hypothetical protein
MRALGIPNTKDFYEVTKIDDAMALWKTQQSRQVGGLGGGRGQRAAAVQRGPGGRPRALALQAVRWGL